MDRRNHKRLFAFGALIFIILLGYASYDISRRTTFPGSKPQLKERLKKTYADPSAEDTVTEKKNPKGADVKDSLKN